MLLENKPFVFFFIFGSYLLAEPAGIWQLAGLLLANAKSCLSGSPGCWEDQMCGQERSRSPMGGVGGFSSSLHGLWGLHEAWQGVCRFCFGQAYTLLFCFVCIMIHVPEGLR
jgi:hypothetical protein